jgi:FkbM family methyltransferase
LAKQQNDYFYFTKEFIMNFSKVNYRSFVGKLLRMPLKLIPRGMVLPILQGRFRGKKWIVGAGEHGYWLGSYELNKRLAFEREVQPGAVVYDIGANVGYFSLLASALAGPEGRVFAFEPLPRNIRYLRQHIQINHLENVDVIEAAVSDRSGVAYFDLGASSAMGHLAPQGELEVQMEPLDALLAEGKLEPPSVMKIDVEGAEYAVLSGAKELLKNHRPLLFLDTHDRKAHQFTIALLGELGYKFKILDGKDMQKTRELIAFP